MNSPISENKQRGVGVFKRWSRKGYAIFGSLKQVVHIGRLSVVLLQCIGQLLLHVETELRLTFVFAEEKGEEKPDLADTELLILVLSTDVAYNAYNTLDDIFDRQQACSVGGFYFKSYDSRN